ncbi:unnamed protein product [Calypogeia fissa]
MSIHFKFRSAVEYDSVNIEGHFVSVINLKDKIIEAKNLGKGTDFDLLITNAQTGEEYTDDAFLVPKNTSVIIKRVPATRAKPILRVDDQPKSLASEQIGTEFTRGSDTAVPPQPLADVTDDSMDDFGVDLYAIPEPQPTKIDFDEDSRFTAVVNKTAADWQRQTQEAYAGGGGRGFGRLAYGRGAARGRGYGRAIPPQGYVCHRCSQPGHFIQHCPTNGDPSYDMRRVKLPVGIPKTRLKADQEGGYILPDGSVAVMQPDESVFAKEADALLAVRPTSAEPPPELRCPLCQAIFKDAVMIPCCHYSFCDKCIRQELISKGKCPQCSSSKFKNDDLLPNIALRQAIDRFLETQVPTTSADDGPKPQPVPDVEPASRPKAPARLQIELRKPAASMAPSATTEAVEKETSPVLNAEPVTDSAAAVSEKTSPADEDNVADANASTEVGASVVLVPSSAPQNSEVVAVQSSKTDENVSDVHPTIVKDVSHLVKGGGMDPVIDDGGGMVNNMSEPPSHKEAEGVALESEVSKGKKKKKRARVITGDGAGDFMGAGKGKRMQGDRFCYICGSPEHLARDCLENPELAHPPHPGMFGPGPPGLPPYGPDMYWQGPQIPQHGRPFPVPYGEGMYGPGPMPFDAPMMPPGPYNMGPYMPPMYHGAPMHGGFMGGGMPPSAMAPMERPLSREEFMEMQERERRRRLMHERLHRDWSPERSYSREGNWHPQTPDSERRRYEHERRGTMEEHQSLIRKRDMDRDSVRNYSDETEIYKKKGGTQDQKHVLLADSTAYRRNASNSDDDLASLDELKSRKPQVEKHRQSGKAVPVSSKRESRHQRDVDVERFSSEFEDDIVEVSYSARRSEKRPKDADLPPTKLSRQTSKRTEDTKSGHLSASGGDSHSSRHRTRKNVVDAGKYDVDYDEEKGFVRSSKYARGRSRSPEQVGRLHVNEFSGSEVDAHDEIREVEKPRRRKHRSHSKSKPDLGTTEGESDDDVKKKKRKHKKHHDEVSLEKSRDGRTDADGDHSSKHRKHHKSKNGSHGVTSSPAHLEHTRWQLDTGHDAVLASHRSKHSKHRRSDNGKVK